MDNGDNTNEVGRNWVCAICDEDIVARGRRFGLLENCSHPFCLECIRRWRDQKGSQDRTNLRLCPLCRVESFLITPSEVYLPDGPDKTEVIRGYKEALARIPCKFVTAGEECPFGSSCYYKHDDDDHDDEERGKRFLCGADGKVQALRKAKLSDYLFPCK
ncbi:makorin, putative [Perkinsus marinus ATCC 50983]|uniref:Makorin, putative n=1 Tax=Perkinsus marinus (strain ATCC 50983 / TXsc) TaxID=423536 RepID=C5KS00_PERM5|nr:makorin, putative [Perkinsus marinus ATCC 50983]EER12691.1 makorin, putative [Perkinsus marinus ATCC 50983]|eukprot:XP_002780896.1 makorin, putative [Perkinsus marinus ATCC 50983]